MINECKFCIEMNQSIKLELLTPIEEVIGLRYKPPPSIVQYDVKYIIVSVLYGMQLVCKVSHYYEQRSNKITKKAPYLLEHKQVDHTP